MCYLHSRNGNVLFKLSSLNDFPRRVSQTGEFKQSLDSFYVTDSTLSVTNIAEIAKLTSVNDFILGEGPVSPTGEFKQSVYSFHVRDSALSVTNIAEMAMFYLNWLVLMIFPYRMGQLVQLMSLNKFLTVSMIQVVL